ncbi:hypothetical protein ACM66B_001961 [Microbotryomycetes sp. NB124-2]
MTHYDTLGVPSSANADQLRAAYIRLAKTYHPDHAPPHLRVEHESRFHAVADAFRVLSDKRSRETYDRSLSLQITPAQLTASPSSSSARYRLASVSPTRSLASSGSSRKRASVDAVASYQTPSAAAPGASDARRALIEQLPRGSLDLARLSSSGVLESQDPLLQTVKYGTRWTLPGRYPSIPPVGSARSQSPLAIQAQAGGVPSVVPGTHVSPLIQSRAAPLEQPRGFARSSARIPQQVSATFNQGESCPDGRLWTHQGRLDVERDTSGAVRWSSTEVHSTYEVASQTELPSGAYAGRGARGRNWQTVPGQVMPSAQAAQRVATPRAMSPGSTREVTKYRQ